MTMRAILESIAILTAAGVVGTLIGWGLRATLGP
jgi:hypothetical protein